MRQIALVSVTIEGSDSPQPCLPRAYASAHVTHSPPKQTRSSSGAMCAGPSPKRERMDHRERAKLVLWEGN